MTARAMVPDSEERVHLKLCFVVVKALVMMKKEDESKSPTGLALFSAKPHKKAWDGVGV